MDIRQAWVRELNERGASQEPDDGVLESGALRGSTRALVPTKRDSPVRLMAVRGLLSLPHPRSQE